MSVCLSVVYKYTRFYMRGTLPPQPPLLSSPRSWVASPKREEKEEKEKKTRKRVVMMSSC